MLPATLAGVTDVLHPGKDMMEPYAINRKRKNNTGVQTSLTLSESTATVQPLNQQAAEKDEAGELTLADSEAFTVTKKRKVRSIQDENRKFQDKWTDEFFFVLQGANPLCLICHKICSGFKRCNLERHFQTLHGKFNDTFPHGSMVRKNKIVQLTASLGEQQKTMHRTNSPVERLTEASFEIAWILARAKRPFSDAHIVKECFLASAEILYADFSNKEAILKQLKRLQLSDSTITRRIEDIGKDISEQVIADVSAASCFSIALESTDVCDVAQLCVWVRFPKEDSFREEMLCLLPLLGQSSGEDILSALLIYFCEKNLKWSGLVSVCTDGAPNMRGKEKGLVELMRHADGIPSFISFHCIIHQEALLAKLDNGELRNVMQLIVRVVNFIVSKAQSNKQFRQLVEEYVTEYGGPALLSEVRWLSRGRVLEHFLSLLPEIHSFLYTKGKSEPDLKNPGCIFRLALLIDLTLHLNTLNHCIQEKEKQPGNILRVVEEFENKITDLFVPDKELIHFPKLRGLFTDNPELQQHFKHSVLVTLLEELRNEFESRFQEVKRFKEFFCFIDNPFTVAVTSLIPVVIEFGPVDCAAFESEAVDLQTHDLLKAELGAGIAHFWSMVSDKDYPTVKQCVQKAMAFFVSTSTCESTFATMNIVKSKHRNRLTNAHLECLTRIATTGYKYNIKNYD